MQIQVDKTLDVEVVEEQLAELWKQTAGARDSDDEAAVLRARVANLLVFVGTDAVLAEVREMLAELTARHPSRVLIMHGARTGEDHDIEMSVETICQTDSRSGAKRLSCEELSLKATGRFVSELPSAALPLLVPDLSTFLWWRNAPHAANKVLSTLLRASDRLVIDSAEFAEPLGDLVETNKLYSQPQFNHVGISDLNWARLTFWRGLLADFYDVPSYQSLLAEMDLVEIDYVAPEGGETSVAPQAFFIAGWLASRLGWKLADRQPPEQSDAVTTFHFLGSERSGRQTVSEGSDVGVIKLSLNRVERGEHKPGRLVQVKLRCSSASRKDPTSFVVTRSADNLHVLAEARVGASVHRGRVLPVRNRSAAQLLSREMEILCNDQIYQEAVVVAAKMIALLSESPVE
jgi:glucose-6-phosphate dehydrogenase assembly protein OpcA